MSHGRNKIIYESRSVPLSYHLTQGIHRIAGDGKGQGLATQMYDDLVTTFTQNGIVDEETRRTRSRSSGK